MEDKSYLLEEVLNDNNLIFNLRLDTIFKKVFLNSNSKPYLCSLISQAYNISYEDLMEEAILINGELPSKNIEMKSINTDIVVRFRNKDFIIEMNYHEKDYTIEKNNSYLFNLHTSKIFNKNKYGKNIYTYLLNIDDYDALNKNDLVYESYLNYPRYNVCMYKNIKIKHFNLAFLRNKIYNEGKIKELNELEKILLPFVCQKKDIIRSITKNNEVRGVIEVMDKLKLDMELPTYDYEEFLRQERIGFAKKKKELYKQEKELNKQEKELNKQEKVLNKRLQEFDNEKFELAKKLIKIGIDGLEVYYTYKRHRSILKFHSEKKVERIANKYNLIKTGGTDEHGSLKK